MISKTFQSTPRDEFKQCQPPLFSPLDSEEAFKLRKVRSGLSSSKEKLGIKCTKIKSTDPLRISEDNQEHQCQNDDL
jgi:hypothetical protein